MDTPDVKIFASIVDDVTRSQVDEMSSCDAYRGCTIRVMPDCHAGKGCTIGSVIAFKDRVVPNTVGVDIGCGMLVVGLGPVEVDLKKLDEVINTYIPSGFNIHDKAVASFDLSLEAPISDKDYMMRSIGTLGGGNHFIEVDVDDDGNHYLVIHSGSRNLGVQVCRYWQELGLSRLTDDSLIRKALIAKLTAEGREREIGDALRALPRKQINKDLAYIEGDDLNGYLHDMGVCQKYASLNRHTMADIIMSHMGWSDCGTFTTIHNYIDIPNRIIRKGAIAAKLGEVVIIPMNMKDGSLLCVGKGNPDWLCSAPHGAGRIMSRAEAIKKLILKDFEDIMRGIYSTSVCESTIDEAPMVYKAMDVIMRDIQDTVEVAKVIRPIYNFKAKETSMHYTK